MDNLSWFGYPDDVTPSVRNLLPGLKKVITPICSPLLFKFGLLPWGFASLRIVRVFTGSCLEKSLAWTAII